MWGKQKVIEETIQCSLVKPSLTFIEPVARQKIQTLMDEYTHQEWLAYLVGRVSEKDNIFVEDIVVPPHKYAYGASAEAEPLHTPKNCVGFIHSHHSMGAFHSATDQDYVDKNYPVSITVARNGQGNLVYDAVSYDKTPCGKDITVKSTIKYVQPAPLFDKKKWLEAAKANIDKSKEIPREIPVTYKYAKDAPYIPLKYRTQLLLEDYITDSQGRVLTKKEIEDIVANSEGVG